MASVIECVRSVIGRADDERKFIVGFSGGADSVALLLAMVREGHRVVAAHCNFMLRGEESERDERFARAMAERLGVEFASVRFDTPAIMAAERGSAEMICRRLRYDWFAQLIEKHNAAAVAIAHHGDDNSETALLNLFRGTGIAGLTGMREFSRRPMAVVRPLLGCSRAEIIEYLRAEGADYVTDSSNLESVYRRNAIRNEILPTIRNHFPDADKGIATTISHLREAEEFIAEMMADLRREYVDADGAIAVGRLLSERGTARFILYEMLAPARFSSTQVDDVIAAATAGNSGRRFITPSGEFILDRGTLRGAEPSDGAECVMSIEVVDSSTIKFGDDVAYFSLDVLEGTPLRLRHWQEGDRLRPFGMRGSKLVSDIFSDAKIPSDRKRQIPLLVKGDEILWVVGLRRSSLYPVDDRSGNVVRVSVSRPTVE